MSLSLQSATRKWPLLVSFQNWRPSDLQRDAIAGLTLAAIAIPEQMATARLGGLGPEIGFLALVAGALGFALFGASRVMSVGADSTVAPIFAGALALLATAGTKDYVAAAAMLALMTGLILVVAGLLRLGFIADLLSVPVTIGFLAGIAAHILVSQGPALLGVEIGGGDMPAKLIALARAAPEAHPWTLALGLGVVAVLALGEKLSPRAPSALIALAAATALTVGLGLETRGVSTLGMLPALSLSLGFPALTLSQLANIAPLAILVAVVVMVQTAATTRGFAGADAPDVNRDFIGVGAANIFAGIGGAFPVNASPPRTAVVAETGGASQLGALVCAALALAVGLFGGKLLAHVPHAALAGVLLFVAGRIFRVSAMADVWRRSPAEFALIVATALAIIFLPIQQGVGLGMMLSLLHGVWTTTRPKAIELERIPGASIWWPKTPGGGEQVPGVTVIALQAPLSFLNAYEFKQSLEGFAAPGVRLIVLEANAIVEIDYTGAKALGEAIAKLRAQDCDVAMARLESVRAQESFRRQGLEALLGADHVFHSVQEAIDALHPAKAGRAS